MRTPSLLLTARMKLAARRRLDRFARAEGGATAVEFGLVLLPFLLLFFGIIELALVYFASMTLENAVVDAGREIRTGQVQTGGGDAGSFKTSVCSRMNWLESGCPAALRVDVRTVATFNASSGLATPKSPCWDPGGAESLVLVRAYYDWPLITPLLQAVMQTANGKRTLTFTTAFANEPYNTDAAKSVTCPE
ncbi:TadE/TadG family type IV pilus assembly protein [Caulobacter endophyticus]|uniref:TadE/TadG family type IV pilus assembly protein n=1 Tax=Caulobacter endophyticus TaxID=2172652 RepID=UPI0024106D16|nr:TadE/TadG family type IV pilus assembly protein [Caulobacter endophyticus]MDG2530975.1 pilus assembly protein [Caulobacter endophyticus]